MFSQLPKGLLLVLVFHLSLFYGSSEGKNVVCYVTNWAQYRPSPYTFAMSDVDPFACSHLIFAFAKVDETGNKLLNYEANDNTPNGLWKQFTDLKKLNPQLKCLLAVGGYTHGSGPFSRMSSSSTNRAQFVQNVITQLRYWNFDGLDLDWEYPGDTTSNDKLYFSLLAQDLRNGFEKEGTDTNRPRLLLAAAVSAGIARLQKGYDIPALEKALDIWNVMTYDYHGSWEMFTGLSSPLYAPNGDALNVASSMDYLVAQGASLSKLHVGLAFYGRSWTLQRSGDTALGSTAIAAGLAGPYTREAGVFSYYEACALIGNGYVSEREPLGQVQIAYKGNQWITYENEDTLDIKLQYAISKNFGGVMVWALDHDDFNNMACGRGRYPLLNVVSKMLEVPDGPTQQPPTTTTTKSTTTTTKSTTTTTTQKPAVTTTTTTTTTKDPTKTGGKFVCPADFGFWPFADTCFRYHMCIMGTPMDITCPDYSLFNPGPKKCEKLTETSYICPY